MSSRRSCPCGGAEYDACCGRLHTGAAVASTAEELMRSRFSAFAVGGRLGADHLFRTWHPRTRPDDLDEHTIAGTTWTRLEIVDVVDGAESDAEGIVEFRAHHGSAADAGVLHERSTFARRAGRWVYVEGTHS